MLHTEIRKTIDALETQRIPAERKHALREIRAYIQQKLNDKQTPHLLFVCTHNSRRSILAEVWATAVGAYYNIPNLQVYSCGTEVTAVHPMVIHTLREENFTISSNSTTGNPTYSIGFGEGFAPIETHSMTFDDIPLQNKGFAAVMVCSSASDNCPYIAGTEKRIALPFEDPKAYDEHPDKKQAYLHTGKEIAREMKFAFQKLQLA
jgi:arsenate reductase